MYFASRGSKIFSSIAQLCDVDFLQGNNTLIWVISDAVSRILTSVLSTSEQIAIQGSTSATTEEQRNMSGSFVAYNNSMATSSGSNNENSSSQVGVFAVCSMFVILMCVRVRVGDAWAVRGIGLPTCSFLSQPASVHAVLSGSWWGPQCC